MYPYMGRDFRSTLKNHNQTKALWEVSVGTELEAKL